MIFVYKLSRMYKVSHDEWLTSLIRLAVIKSVVRYVALVFVRGERKRETAHARYGRFGATRLRANFVQCKTSLRTRRHYPRTPRPAHTHTHTRTRARTRACTGLSFSPLALFSVFTFLPLPSPPSRDLRILPRAHMLKIV